MHPASEPCVPRLCTRGVRYIDTICYDAFVRGLTLDFRVVIRREGNSNAKTTVPDLAEVTRLEKAGTEYGGRIRCQRVAQVTTDLGDSKDVDLVEWVANLVSKRLGIPDYDRTDCPPPRAPGPECPQTQSPGIYCLPGHCGPVNIVSHWPRKPGRDSMVQSIVSGGGQYSLGYCVREFNSSQTLYSCDV